MIGATAERWARLEFGHCKLGDQRRTARLVAMAGRVAARPNGKITNVFGDVAGREAAYRLIENEAVDPHAIRLASHEATARRARLAPHVFVPVDQTSVTLRDRTGDKGLGAICRLQNKVSGLQLMSALAVEESGAPLGLCGQVYWTRGRTKGRQYSRIALHLKETQRWLDVMEQTREIFGQHAPLTRPWFQMDRGADAWAIYLAALERGDWVTVRATHNRRLVDESMPKRERLWSRVGRQEPAGCYVLDVPRRWYRRGRQALMQIQYCPVTLDLAEARLRRRRYQAQLWAVRVVEIETTPRGEKPIEWMLLTTRPVRDLQDAVAVVLGYSSRWRIEELHRAWKRGACNVEQSQLRSRLRFERWASILMAVAARIERLTYLARETPDQPASSELSRAEIDAAILLRKPNGFSRGDEPTLSQAIRWIADLGGYVGPKSSGGPPGATVVSRGFEQVKTVARVLADL